MPDTKPDVVTLLDATMFDVFLVGKVNVVGPDGDEQPEPVGDVEPVDVFNAVSYLIDVFNDDAKLIGGQVPQIGAAGVLAITPGGWRGSKEPAHQPSNAKLRRLSGDGQITPTAKRAVGRKAERRRLDPRHSKAAQPPQSDPPPVAPIRCAIRPRNGV